MSPLLSRAWRRRTWLGLLTLLGARPKGFFIPYRYAANLPAPGARPRYEAMESLFAEAGESFHRVLSGFETFEPDLKAIGDEPPPAPRWSQDWFPPLDAAAAYTITRQLKPRRILEVGSGHSTRFFCRAVRDGGLKTEITAIDPAPRAVLLDLPVTWRRETLPLKGLSAFETLQAGDILAIDSSHILMPGSDVDFLFGRVLPILPAGVWVQIHDIFLPEDYPVDWAWRGYNEQLGLMTLLQGGSWKVRFASHYVAQALRPNLEQSFIGGLAFQPGNLNSAFWIEKR